MYLLISVKPLSLSIVAIPLFLLDPLKPEINDEEGYRSLFCYCFELLYLLEEVCYKILSSSSSLLLFDESSNSKAALIFSSCVI